MCLILSFSRGVVDFSFSLKVSLFRGFSAQIGKHQAHFGDRTKFGNPLIMSSLRRT